MKISKQIILLALLLSISLQDSAQVGIEAARSAQGKFQFDRILKFDIRISGQASASQTSWATTGSGS
jgi:hypothetical protein